MNLPTKVTVARIALIPIFIVFYCLKDVFQQYYIPMTIMFIIASCTDFIDGNLARKHNMVTDLGKFLDPIADKILVVAGMIVLLNMTFIPKGSTQPFPVLAPYYGEICVILILTREFIIGVFRQLAASKGKVMAADKLGKAKTVITLIALPMLMLVPFINENNIVIHWIGVIWLFLGWALFGVATILTVVSGFNYIWKNKHVFATEQTEEKLDKQLGSQDIEQSEVLSDIAADNVTKDNEENCNDK